MVLGLLNFMFSWEKTSAALKSTPEVAAIGLGPKFLIITIVISTIINLIIWYFISARASKVAKVIFTVFFVAGLSSMVTNFNNPLSPKGLALVATLVITLIQAAATYMLFRSDANAWFDNKPVDPGTFR